MEWTERKRMEKRLRAQRFYESEIGRAIKEMQKKTYEANKDEIKKNGFVFVIKRARQAAPATSKV